MCECWGKGGDSIPPFFTPPRRRSLTLRNLGVKRGGGGMHTAYIAKVPCVLHMHTQHKNGEGLCFADHGSRAISSVRSMDSTFLPAISPIFISRDFLQVFSKIEFLLEIPICLLLFHLFVMLGFL